MKQRRFELFIAFVLTLISLAGTYYLKEPRITDVGKQTFQWYLLDITWLLSMVLIGYLGLKNHEFKWIKPVWIVVNIALLLLLLFNKIMLHFFQHPFVMEGSATILRTPFFFLMAAYLPRWFMRYNPPKQR